MLRRVLYLCVAASVVAAVLLMIPSRAPAGPVDALVVFAGGTGERLDRAEELVRSGRARALAISHGTGWPQGRRLCRAGRVSTASGRVPVVCFSPVPDSTKGEAIAIGRLASARRWRTVGVVTSSFHVRRAVLLTRRCAHGVRVEAVGVAPELTRVRTWVNVFREEGAIVAALTVDRGC